MSRWLKCASAMSFAVSLTMATAGRAAAQDSLAAARELYASAAYEDALALLNRLRAPTSRLQGYRPSSTAGSTRSIRMGRSRSFFIVWTSSPAVHQIRFPLLEDLA